VHHDSPEIVHEPINTHLAARLLVLHCKESKIIGCELSLLRGTCLKATYELSYLHSSIAELVVLLDLSPYEDIIAAEGIGDTLEDVLLEL
jgi:hypothetical protein